jgi:arylsulfatase
LIVQWPNGIAARGELRQNPGHLIDLVPTILDVAGGEPFATVVGPLAPPPPGRSLRPVFAKDGTVSHEYFWWMHEKNRALRVGDWKIVAAGADSPWELYDLRTDRAESNNLAGKDPDRVRQLAGIWDQHLAEFLEIARRDNPPEGPAKKAKKQKAADQ